MLTSDDPTRLLICVGTVVRLLPLLLPLLPAELSVQHCPSVLVMRSLLEVDRM